MLSHDKLPFFVRPVPPQTIIVDEVSQVELGDYLPLLQRFRATLRKMVFIGDDKQLPPYGQGDIPELCSVFEKPHLRKGAVLLDTQYRMPKPIGDFISREVYHGRLKSVHTIVDMAGCIFVDVSSDQEQKSGHSWVNLREVAAATNLAKIFQKLGKSFRIITPYDAQRSKIENALKVAKIPWEDRCFNVDSFQGNEADYIVLSIVHSMKIGFVKDPRRTNIMLTRCKKSMIILANRNFIQGEASSTLLGKLAKTWGSPNDSSWENVRTITNGSFRPRT